MENGTREKKINTPTNKTRILETSLHLKEHRGHERCNYGFPLTFGCLLSSVAPSLADSSLGGREYRPESRPTDSLHL